MAKLKLNIMSIFSLLLIFAGVVFYLLWGVFYDGWNLFAKDYIGVYAITVVLLLFGTFGYLLMKKKSEQVPGKK